MSHVQNSQGCQPESQGVLSGTSLSGKPAGEGQFMEIAAPVPLPTPPISLVTTPPPPEGGGGVINDNERELGALRTSNPKTDACRSGEASQDDKRQ
jgi:hypothetical protein